MRTLRALGLLMLPMWMGAQTPADPRVVERPMAQLAAERLAITPVQFWRADTTGWSSAADGKQLRADLDSAIAREFRERGMGNRWAYAGDVVRSARRNPTLRGDPAALGAGRWRSVPPQPGEGLPTVVADNLRMISALGDTRYALIPVELRASGVVASLRLVLADTRRRTVVWSTDLVVDGSSPTVMVEALAKRLADLAVDP